jgi:hypothetical protein
MDTMAHLRPPPGLARRFLIALTLASCLTGGASATAGLRPDPKPRPQPRPEPPPQTRVSPQPPPAQPPTAEPAPPVVVRTPSRPAGATHRPTETHRPKERSTREARREARRAAARVLRERATVRRTTAVREVPPLAFSDSQSNARTVVLLAMGAVAATLLLIGFGVSPARAARWPAAARLLEGDLLVTTGFAILAASGTFLLLLLIIPA